MERTWWKEAVVYQVYPRSFFDANGDGIGDLAGIIAKLDYLRDLGVDALWLSPVYASPNVDNGYDISDYREIMADFGTMADFDRLLAEAHAHGLRVVMDMVVNHTSDQHAWFAEARASRDNPRRDFYIWREGRDGCEPNNWKSEFGGSAWEYNPATGDYYLHVFAPQQPDLNWEHPPMRQAIYEMMNWWLDKGVDGFRLDVINFLMKAPGLPDVPRPADAPPEQQYFSAGQFYVDHPGIHDLLQEMGREVFQGRDILTVGECHGITVTPETGWQYVSAERGELNMMFHFDITWLFTNGQAAQAFQRIADWHTASRNRGWTTLTLNNHDTPRQVSAIGDAVNYRVESAKAIAVLLLTAPGTPFLYQGEELGMTNVAFPSIADYRDVGTLRLYHEALAAGMPEEMLMAEVHRRSRDNARTPMQWSAAPHAGFTTGDPWLGINPNYREINANTALQDPDSVLHWYRRLLRFRKANPALVYGDFRLLPFTTEGVYGYERTLDDTTLIILLNWTSHPAEIAVPSGELLLCNYPDHDAKALRPWEARIYKSSA